MDAWEAWWEHGECLGSMRTSLWPGRPARICGSCPQPFCDLLWARRAFALWVPHPNLHLCKSQGLLGLKNSKGLPWSCRGQHILQPSDPLLQLLLQLFLLLSSWAEPAASPVTPCEKHRLFLCIDHWGRLSYLSLLFFGTLHSDGCVFPYLSPLPFAFLLFSAICRASSDNYFAFLHFFFW